MVKIVEPNPVHEEILSIENAIVFVPLPTDTYIVKLSPDATKNDPFDVIPFPLL